MKKRILIVPTVAACLLVAGCKGNQEGEALSQVSVENAECFFDETFQVKTVSILSEKEAQGKGVPFALVRNPNEKLAFMAKDDGGKMQPFYMRGIEVGGWGMGRDGAPNYDEIFENYNKLSANSAMFIIHWSDFEPEDGKFDFTYADGIVEKARAHGIKIVWVLFMHQQFDMRFVRDAESQWMYNFDTRDGENYAIQWVKDKEGNLVKDIPTHREKGYTEIMPCYSNPKVYSRIIRMLSAVADHYKDSKDVIGVQVGNEEHFSYQGEDSDFNPYTLADFEKWKKQTGETSWTRFKLAMVKLYFSRFTTAYHMHDPYKVTMINPIAGGPEKGETGIIDKSGTDATTFRDSKIDAIATMFYWANGSNVWKNLDQVYRINDHYSYATQLPILLSTEIGIRNLNTWPYTQEYMINFLERGSQGFAVFAYGSMIGGRRGFGPPSPNSEQTKEGELNSYGIHYRNFMDMVIANEDIIWGGLPGIGYNISITSTYGGGKISSLHNGNNATLGILHFPDDLPDEIEEMTQNIPVEIIAKEAGKYSIEVYMDGKLLSSYDENLAASKGKVIYVSISNKNTAFIKVKKQ